MALEQWLLGHARVSGKQHQRIKMDDKMSFFQQLATLVSSGTPLLESLRIAGQQNQSTRLRAILSDVAGRVAAGCSLHDAMAEYRHVFNDHWVELIRTGEMTGKMDLVLCDLNQQIRESGETRRKITGALLYPIILTIVAALVVSIMLGFVVPRFKEMFDEMGAELPGITLFVLSVSDFLVAYGAYLVVGIVGLAVAIRQYMKSDGGRRRVSAIALASPVVGDLMVQSAMYRFSSNLGLLLKSGVPILETLSALSAVFRSNPLYRDAIRYAQVRVSAGRTLADSLEETRLFATMMTRMVRIGEESAQLPLVMEQMAPYYKDKMHAFISKLTKLLEPAIIIVMGFAMTLLMLAIYMPMFEMSGKVN